ncbi:GMC oxidoreductase [Halopseudomonas pelagia]|uniref:2-keto-gluconate dehydrogenase n=1 Tax=Halopseudomonas pelagia TaxID=553151 RepID=A0AA91U645_9GAMM|nr:GMC family oxidoreductase [Halopseudomonas pelagia]PCD01032.1 2-keto-gluconate dehydrogenase [Halopseudomonas pelagia]QFY57181.1 GMC family oxidoreductase [Halopseudomonas pelagia]
MKFNRVMAGSLRDSQYELIVIGSGFGSCFFLEEALKHVSGRVLIIEWGDFHPWAWQIEHKASSLVAPETTFASLGASKKPWNTTIAMGGGLNCWFSQTPRFHPNDFKTQSLYGVGFDWPLSYEELEPYYCKAESIMCISGDPDMARVLPRSQPFPQPPHKGSSIDVLMKAAMPDQHFIMPTGRARVANGQRSVCCANATCNLCPVNAKFTAQNGFAELFSHPKVDVCLNAEVKTFEYQGSTITGLTLMSEGKEYRVGGDQFVLGANAIQSPAILLRSDINDGDTGMGLHEQLGANVEVFLDGLGNFDGSTITTGLNYALYDGDFRRERSGCLVYFENRWPHGLRMDKDRWNQILPMMLTAEDLPDRKNRISIDPENGQAIVDYQGESEYGKIGLQHGLDQLEKLLSPLPVESIQFRGWRLTESHVQGTLRMGHGEDGSVIDANMLHHRMRNLVIVGTATYPSCSPANPSLTAAALSIRAADRLYG